MNKTLEKLAQAIFKRWFIDFEFPNEEGEPYKSSGGKMVESGIDFGRIPDGWKLLEMGSQVMVKGGTTPSTKNAEYWDNGNITWCTPKDLSKLLSPVLLYTERKITKKGLAMISSGLLPKGTLLLSSRAPIGYVAIANIPVSINQGLNISNYFLLFWIKENLEIIKNMANGSTFQEINKSSFKKIELLVPQSWVLACFDSILENIYRKIVQNEIESLSLSQIRDSLLPRLMSGKIRVNYDRTAPRG